MKCHSWSVGRIFGGGGHGVRTGGNRYKEQQRQDRTVKVQRKRKRAHDTKTKRIQKKRVANAHKMSMLAIQMLQARYSEKPLSGTFMLIKVFII